MGACKLDTMTSRGEDTSLHVVNYSGRTSTTRMARQPRSNRNDHPRRSVVGSQLPRDVQSQIPTSPTNQLTPSRLLKRSTHSADLIPFFPSSRYPPSLQLSHMCNNNHREDDDEEYTGDGTSHNQACFVSTGSPILSILVIWVVDVHDLLGWFGGYYQVQGGWIVESLGGCLFISRVHAILRDIPISPKAKAKGKNVVRLASIAISIDGNTMIVVRWEKKSLH